MRRLVGLSVVLLLAAATDGRVRAEDPPPAPAPEPAVPAPPDPAEAAKAAREARAAARAALPESGKKALADLDGFERKRIRTWSSFRGDLLREGEAAVPPLLWALGDPDWEMRAFAASCLASLRAPSSVEPLLAAYRTETFAEGRRQIALALAAVADERCTELLRTIAADPAPGLRLAALGGLAKVSKDLADFRRHVDDEDLDVRYEALGALAERGDPAVVARLAAAAKALVADRDTARVDTDERLDDGVRYEMYLLGLALARATDGPLQKTTLDILGGEKPWERKQFLRMGISDGFGRRYTGAGAPMPKAVVRALTHDELSVRVGAVRALGGSGDPSRVAALARGLGDSQIDVRHEAVVALGRIATDDAVKAIHRAQQDRAEEVRLGAVRALDAIPGAAATKALVDASRDDKYLIRLRAVRALGRRVAETGVDAAILKAAKDPDYGVRELATAALARHPLGETVVAPLLSALSDPDPGVKANACVALSRLSNAPSVAASPAISARVVDLHLAATEPKLRRSTTEFLDAVRSPHCIPPLLDALGAPTLEVRRRADSILRRVTERSFDFDPKAEKPLREAAIARWRAWWLAAGSLLPEREATALSAAVVTSDDGGAEGDVTQLARDFKWRGLDLAILLDSTVTMSGVIRSMKERIDEIIGEVRTLLPNLRISVYSYRDVASEYVYYGTPLTFDAWKLSGFLQPLAYGTGVDLPEGVAEGVINATETLAWRDDAYKVVLYAGDAPHHPEGESDFLAKIKGFFTKRNKAQLNAVFMETDRRALDVKARRERPGAKDFVSPTFSKYRMTAEAGRGRAIVLDDDSALIREVLVIAFGERARAEIEILLDFER